MQYIWKFQLYPAAEDGTCSLSMPAGARVIHVGGQGPAICLWAIVDPGAPSEDRKFRIVGTGWPCDFADYEYLGTVQQEILVWHVFDIDSARKAV